MAISLIGINAALIKVNNKITQKATLITQEKKNLKEAQEKLLLFERIRKKLIEAKRALELANEHEGELE